MTLAYEVDAEAAKEADHLAGPFSCHCWGDS